MEQKYIPVFRDESYDDDNPSGGWWGLTCCIGLKPMGFAVLLILLLQ